MLGSANGRIGHAHSSALVWGEQGGLKLAPVQPTKATWVQIEHLDANKHRERAVASFQRKHKCSVVIEPIRRVEPILATPPTKKSCNKGRSTAAKDRKLRAAGAEIVSALATINIRVLTDEKLADIVQWMGRMNISAVALQEVAAKANNFLSLGARYTLHMGPCGQGPKGGAMRGCAWVVDNQWARQVGFEMGVSTVHSSSISIATSTGRVELVSIYSAPGVGESAEETELSSRSKRAPVVWLGDINDDPTKPSTKSYWGDSCPQLGTWRSTERVAGRRCPLGTRPPIAPTRQLATWT
jgi:hypothetical protein